MQVNKFRANIKDTALILSFINIMESNESVNKGMLSLFDLYKIAKQSLLERGVISEDTSDEILQ